MSLPSTKVLTQFVVAIVLAALAGLMNSTGWTAGLPAWMAPIAVQLVAMVVAYIKAETNPAPSAAAALVNK